MFIASRLVFLPDSDYRQKCCQCRQYHNPEYILHIQLFVGKSTVFRHQIIGYKQGTAAVCRHDENGIEISGQRAFLRIIGNNRLPRFGNHSLKGISDNKNCIDNNKIRNPYPLWNQMCCRKQENSTDCHQYISSHHKRTEFSKPSFTLIQQKTNHRVSYTIKNIHCCYQ